MRIAALADVPVGSSLQFSYPREHDRCMGATCRGDRLRVVRDGDRRQGDDHGTDVDVHRFINREHRARRGDV